MGLLSSGTPLTWEESKEHIEHVKTEGLKQFAHIYRTKEGLRGNILKWGDEVEYTILTKDPADGLYKLQCAAPALLQTLRQEESDQPFANAQVLWHPEYSNWQIEGTPAEPYRCYVTDLLLVESNMALRRSIIQKHLGPGQHVATLTNVPFMGVPGNVLPPAAVGGPVTNSRFLSDNIINPHPRFATLTANIRHRRGRNVDICVPLFEDEATPPTPAAAREGEGGEARPSLADGIKMDCMGFGMGACCLQVTLQARDVGEARVLYDQLGVLAPIMLAVTAATPAWRGHLAATDVRWNVISQSVDCRTAGERGEAPLAPGEQALAKSRYAGISSYIAPRPADAAAQQPPLAAAPMAGDDAGAGAELEPEAGGAATEPEPVADGAAGPAAVSTALGAMRLELMTAATEQQLSTGGAGEGGGGCCKVPDHLPEYDDSEPAINQSALEFLLQQGIDEVMAKHVASMYVRDPLVVYREKLEQDNTLSNDHYENIQSTNWNSVRFKLPPPGSDIGWRVEFRTMELQLTDFENAAFSIFVVLLSRIIIVFNLNFYIPMSKNDANMETAHATDAVVEEKFYFRKQCISPKACDDVLLYHSTSPAIRAHSAAAGILHKRFPSVFGASQQGDFSEAAPAPESDPNGYGLMSCDEILNGSDAADGESGAFPGLIPLIHAYLDLIECTGATRAVLNCYLELVGLRASGQLVTAAKWIRNFVQAHEAYQKDSVVGPAVHNDLIEACLRIGNGALVPEELLGSLNKRMQSVMAILAEDLPGGISPQPREAAGGGTREEPGQWDLKANARWQDILARLSTKEPDEAGLALRGASMCD
jgi:glutamate--cysteine ligase catalytic subunit